MSAVFRPPAALLFSVTIVAAFSAATSCSRSAGDEPHPPSFSFPDRPRAALPAIPRPDPAQLPALSPEIPAPPPAKGRNTSAETLRRDYDTLSWRTFVALSWPALPNGEPDHSQILGQTGDNRAVWDHWEPVSPALRPGELSPSLPTASPARPSLSPALPALSDDRRILTQFAPVPALLGDLATSFKNGPIVDQNGRYVRFEILHGQPGKAAVRRGSHPTASVDGGSIILKAAWKILSPAEIAAGRFHAVEAVIRTPASDDGAQPERVEPATVGLVGLHIVHKSESSLGWIRSSFEHVDNCPTAGEAPYRAVYNFYNKATPEARANLSPGPPWNPAAIEPPHRRPQIVRETPIEASTRDLNAAYQAALRAVNPASVWQYYELVDTEWTVGARSDGRFADSLQSLQRAR